MQLKIKKLDERAKMPTKGHPGDAGIDFYALEEVVFAPSTQGYVRTGLALEIPEGHVGLVWDKSSISFKNNLKVMGGVIDAGFRGEFTTTLFNVGPNTQTIKAGQKIVQMLIQKFEDCDIVEVESLSETVRGEGREGSTGQA
jgi:dUTP pyrophosphatase